MKITVNRESFLKSLTTAMLGMGTNSPTEAWQCLRIEVEDKKMNVYARNSELQVQSFAKALKSDEDHAFCVPGKLFYDTVKSLTSEDLIITTVIKGKAHVTTISIKGAKKRFTMTGIDPQHWAPFHTAKEFSFVKMVMEPLSEAVGVASSVSKEDILRLSLNGVGMQCFEGKIYVSAATHIIGTKLVIESVGEIPDMLISRATATVLQSLEVVPEIEVGSNGDHVVFNTGQAIVTSSLSAYKFPFSEMSKFWALKQDAHIVIERKEFLASVKRMTAYAKSEKADYIIIAIKDDSLTLTCTTLMNADSGHEELDVENNGLEVKIALSPKAMSTALSSMNSDYINFHAVDSSTMVHLSEKDSSSNPEHNWLIMPISADGL